MMAIKYPIRKRIRKGPRIVNRGTKINGILGLRGMDPHSGAMTPDHKRGGGHGAKLKP
jgi:hypothetical protein